MEVPEAATHCLKGVETLSRSALSTAKGHVPRHTRLGAHRRKLALRSHTTDRASHGASRQDGDVHWLRMLKRETLPSGQRGRLSGERRPRCPTAIRMCGRPPSRSAFRSRQLLAGMSTMGSKPAGSRTKLRGRMQGWLDVGGKGTGGFGMTLLGMQTFVLWRIRSAVSAAPRKPQLGASTTGHTSNRPNGSH